MSDVVDKEREGRADRLAKRLWFEENPGPPWVCVFCPRPITHRGKSADSLHLHHPNEDNGSVYAELESAHMICHMRRHARERKRKEREARCPR